MVEERILKDINPNQINKRNLKRRVKKLLVGIERKIPNNQESDDFDDAFFKKLDSINQKLDSSLVLKTTFQYRLLNPILMKIENTYNESIKITERIKTCSESEATKSLLSLILEELTDLDNFLISIIDDPETVYKEFRFQNIGK